ncbi:MAG: 3-isopropylmalate dehydratase small subunit [Parvularculaceae bacterium]|nr:3-isopropylmalate dehydratase small subunit [Parvularculaceae bacterium]
MPDPLIQHCGLVAHLPKDNIDTDQIIPSREMKTVSRSGLADGLFAGWRYVAPDSRQLNPDFVLNQDATAGATVLVAGANFGCGSSREHAVWALAEYGFRVIIAKSFNQIFHDNCLRNGVLPIVLDNPSGGEALVWSGGCQVVVDLGAQTVTRADQPNWVGRFAIDAYPKRMLMEGLDPIGFTLAQRESLEAFAERDAEDRPWVYADYSAA